MVRYQGKTPQGGKQFQFSLLIRLSLNVSTKREYNDSYLQPQNCQEKSNKQHPRDDEPNNANNQNHDSEACGKL